MSTFRSKAILSDIFEKNVKISCLNVGNECTQGRSDNIFTSQIDFWDYGKHILSRRLRIVFKYYMNLNTEILLSIMGLL